VTLAIVGRRMIWLGVELLLRRALSAVPILLCVSALVFIVLRLLPADPIAMSLPPGASAEDYVRLRTAFGLDRSLPVQYLLWLQHLATGDFGTSIFFRRPVLELVAQSLPATLELVVCGLALGVMLGIAGGLALFATRGRWAGAALDEFLWAILLILAVGVGLRWLPSIGRLSPDLGLPPKRTGFLLVDGILAGRADIWLSAASHLILPSVALAVGLAPLIMRVLSSSMIDSVAEDYITQARLRGLPTWRILVRHALPNAALPTISLIGVQGGFMFGGTLLVEMIFAYPGLGNLMIDAVKNHDLPVIQTAALVYCVLVLSINAVVEVAYLLVNPRLRVSPA
jgi:ABC-type dipeptide/oligopeptide/nickel transport system permease component